MGLYLHFEQDTYEILTGEYQEGKEIIISKPDGQAKSCNINRLYCLTKDSQNAQTSELEKNAKSLVSRIDVLSLWQKFHQLPEPPDGESLTLEIFGDRDPVHHLALFIAIYEDKIYFKRKGQLFHPRSEKEVKERIKTKTESQEYAQELENFLNLFRDHQNFSLQEIPESCERLVGHLKSYAAESHDLKPEQRREIRELLYQLCQLKNLEHQDIGPQTACKFLEELGVINNYADLILYRHHQKKLHSKQIKQEVTKLQTNYQKLLKQDNRQDLTRLEMITIDDQATKDMDDALSLEQDIDGWKLGIHISDIASLIPKDSIIDQAALKRSTSVYSTGETINMLPDLVAENLGSLICSEIRPALSLVFNLNRHYQITQTKIFRSLIRVGRRLSYDEADQLLEQEDPLISHYFQIANEMEGRRIASGAVRTPKQVSDTKLENGKLRLEVFDENDFSRNIIAEMMIAANQAFAEYALRNFLPLFFRCQEAPEKSDQSENFKPSYTSLTAKPHHALGLTAYLQATSPIRRYLDLCNQRQIISHLSTKKGCYDRKDLDKIKRLTFLPLKDAANASREAKRYWLLEYLKQNFKIGAEFEADVLRNDKKLGLVLIRNLLITGLVALPSTVAGKSRIRVRLLEIKPEIGDLKLEFIGLAE